MNLVDFRNNLSIDTSRGPSRAIWADCPWDDIAQRKRLGQIFFDDFYGSPFAGQTVNTEASVGQWNIFLDNNAAVKAGIAADTTNLPLEGGVLGLTAGTNNNLSISMAAPASSFRFVTNASGNALAGQKLWFECSFAVSSVADQAFDLFLGLMDTGDAGTRITSANNLVFSAADTIKTAASMGACLGFWKRAHTNPTDVGIVHNVNNGTAQTLGTTSNIKKLSTNYANGTTGQAMAALSVTNFIAKAIGDTSGACFLKLGFIYDPQPQFQSPRIPGTTIGTQTSGVAIKPLVRFFVNGYEIPIFYDNSIVVASTFPNTFLAPVIGFRSGTSGTGTAYIDFMQVAQLGSI